VNPGRTYVNGHSRRREPYVVDGVTGCWVWTGTLEKDGYAVMVRDGRKLRVARVFWERRFGPIPGDLTIDHLCRNKACVRPGDDHTELCTRAENTRRSHIGMVRVPREALAA
jgi:hypothetical protein